MTQQINPMDRASSYLHQQGAKTLEELAALITQSNGAWQACLQGIDEEQAIFQPEPSEQVRTPISGEGPKWCVKEVVGHYLVSERSLNNTVARFAGVEGPGDPGPVVRDMGVQSPEHEVLTLDALRVKLSDFFDETLGLIASLGASSNMEATFPHPALGPLNVKEWLAFHGLHALDHIDQIERIKTGRAYPKA